MTTPPHCEPYTYLARAYHAESVRRCRTDAMNRGLTLHVLIWPEKARRSPPMVDQTESPLG